MHWKTDDPRSRAKDWMGPPTLRYQGNMDGPFVHGRALAASALRILAEALGLRPLDRSHAHGTSGHASHPGRQWSLKSRWWNAWFIVGADRPARDYAGSWNGRSKTNRDLEPARRLVGLMRCSTNLGFHRSGPGSPRPAGSSPSRSCGRWRRARTPRTNRRAAHRSRCFTWPTVGPRSVRYECRTGRGACAGRPHRTARCPISRGKTSTPSSGPRRPRSPDPGAISASS
jgi:hypothetical protein